MQQKSFFINTSSTQLYTAPTKFTSYNQYEAIGVRCAHVNSSNRACHPCGRGFRGAHPSVRGSQGTGRNTREPEDSEIYVYMAPGWKAIKVNHQTAELGTGCNKTEKCGLALFFSFLLKIVFGSQSRKWSPWILVFHYFFWVENV